MLLKKEPHTKDSTYQITPEEIENNSESETDEDEDSTGDDSFILYQVKAVINQAKSKVEKKTHLIANLIADLLNSLTTTDPQNSYRS